MRDLVVVVVGGGGGGGSVGIVVCFCLEACYVFVQCRSFYVLYSSNYLQNQSISVTQKKVLRRL